MAITGIEVRHTIKGKEVKGSFTKKTFDTKVTSEMLVSEIRNEAVTTTREATAEEQRKGFDKKPIVATDGVVGKPMELVKPWGRIEVRANEANSEVLLFIYRELFSNIKRVTGKMSDTIWVMYNRTIVARSFQELQAFLENTLLGLQKGAQFRFIVTAPYSHRMEMLGVKKGSHKSPDKRIKVKKDKWTKTGQRIKIPNGAATVTVRAVKRKYKLQGKIKYTVVYGQELGLTSPAKGSGFGRVRQSGRSAGRFYTYPAVYYEILGGLDE